MSDLKISQLPAATAPASTDVLPVVQSGTTKKLSVDNLRKGVMSGPGFSATVGGTGAIGAGAFTQVPADTVEFNVGSCYNNTTFKFTPNVAGWYQVNATVDVNTQVSRLVAIIYKNGSAFKWGVDNQAASNIVSGSTVSTLVYLNGTTDYLEAYIFSGSASNFTADAKQAYFQAFLVGAA